MSKETKGEKPKENKKKCLKCGQKDVGPFQRFCDKCWEEILQSYKIN